MNSNLPSLMSEHFLKRIKPFRIVYISLDCRICVCLKVNIKILGGPKSQKSGSGHIQNYIILFPARS